MTFEEWYEANAKYMTAADFKPWMSEAWDAAVLAEREQCAQVCEAEEFAVWETAERCAAAIRARGEK